MSRFWSSARYFRLSARRIWHRDQRNWQCEILLCNGIMAGLVRDARLLHAWHVWR